MQTKITLTNHLDGGEYKIELHPNGDFFIVHDGYIAKLSITELFRFAPDKQKDFRR